MPNHEIIFTADVNLINWAVFYIVFLHNNWYHIMVKMETKDVISFSSRYTYQTESIRFRNTFNCYFVF